MSELNLRSYPLVDLYKEIGVDASAPIQQVFLAFIAARFNSRDHEYWNDVGFVLLNPFVNVVYKEQLKRRSPATIETLDQVLAAERITRTLSAPRPFANVEQLGLRQAAVHVDTARLISAAHVANFVYVLQEGDQFADLESALKLYKRRHNPCEFDSDNLDHLIALAAVWPNEADAIIRDCLHKVDNKQTSHIQAAIVLGVAQRMVARGEIAEFEPRPDPRSTAPRLRQSPIARLRQEAENDLPEGHRLRIPSIIKANTQVIDVLEPLGADPLFRELAANWARAGYPRPDSRRPDEGAMLFKPWVPSHPTTFDIPLGMKKSPQLTAYNQEQFEAVAAAADNHAFGIVLAAASLIAMNDALSTYELLPAERRDMFAEEALWSEWAASGSGPLMLGLYEQFAERLRPVPKDVHELAVPIDRTFGVHFRRVPADEWQL